MLPPPPVLAPPDGAVDALALTVTDGVGEDVETTEVVGVGVGLGDGGGGLEGGGLEGGGVVWQVQVGVGVGVGDGVVPSA